MDSCRAFTTVHGGCSKFISMPEVRGAYLHVGVPLDLALKIVRVPRPADVYNASVAAKNFPFKRVRVICQPPRVCDPVNCCPLCCRRYIQGRIK
jgi:hypothetical protein